MEICDTELETKSSQLIILSIYRASTGDFKQLITTYINKLDNPLKHLHKPKA